MRCQPAGVTKEPWAGRGSMDWLVLETPGVTRRGLSDAVDFRGAPVARSGIHMDSPVDDTARVGPVESDRDLEGILSLQSELRTPTVDGFVTVRHSMDILRRMHALAPSVVARAADGRVVGYAIVMLREARPLVPVLDPMFDRVEELPPSLLSRAPDPRWYVMGQVAVAPSHRGQGVFDALYAEHRARYQDRFDAVVTEVATRNPRSLRAHARVGFRTVLRYQDDTDDWAVIAWDWRSPPPA